MPFWSEEAGSLGGFLYKSGIFLLLIICFDDVFPPFCPSEGHIPKYAYGLSIGSSFYIVLYIFMF